MPDEMTPTEPAVWDLASGLVEDVGKRSQNSKLFSASDGSQTSLMVSNLHYQPRPGEWEPQDLNFQVNGDYQEVGRHWFRTRVSDEGIEVLESANNIGIQWEFSGLNVDGHCARCSIGGVEWSYEVGPRRLKLSGTVRTPQGLRTYSFPYQPLGDASDFTIIDGNAVADGLFVAAPFIIGNNEQQYIIPSGWVLQSSQLTFTFDDSILPPEAYPYIIDPTTTFQPDSAGIDTMINSPNPTTNYGTSTETSVGDGNTAASGAHRGIIKFDVSSIDSADIVSAATLSLYEHTAEDQHSVGTWSVKLQKLRRDWVEGEVTWNIWKTGNNWSTAGAGNTSSDIYSATTATVTLDGTVANAFIDWSDAQLTSDVQDFVSGALSNYGWRIQAPDIEDAGANRTRNAFSLSDHSTSSQRPKLVVVHASSFTPKAIMF